MKLLTISQAAEILGVAEHAVISLLRQGQLTYIDVSVTQNSKRPRKRIREADLLAFIESRRVTPPARHAPRSRMQQRRAALGVE